MRSSRRFVRAGLPVVAAAVVGLGFSGSAPAQDGHRMMFMDDGAGPMVIHASMPNMRELRTPDFVRADLPLFRDKLELGDAQQATVSALLDEYLESFDTLAQISLPAERQVAFGGGDFVHEHNAEADFGPGGGIDHIVMDALHGPDGLSDLDIDVSEGPTGMSVAVFAGAGGPPPEGMEGGERTIEVVGVMGEDEEGGPAMMDGSGVFVAVETGDGEEMSDEMRKALEAKAEEIAERLKERMEAAQEAGLEMDHQFHAPSMEERQRHFDEMAEQAKQFKVAKESMRREFVTTVRSHLEEPQLEKWPGLERALVRKKTLPKGRLDGERTDLLEIVDRTYLRDTERAAIAETLDAYELALNDALVRRNAYVGEAQQRVDDAIREQRPDEALAIIDRATNLRVAVRNTNEQFARAIAEQLEAETATAFTSQVKSTSYPRVYRDRYAHKVFAAARNLDGLDDDAALQVDELARAYTTESDLMNEQIRRAIDQHQPSESRRAVEQIAKAMEQGGAFEFGGGNDDPVREAFKRRKALDERYVKYLRDALTPEQVAELPAQPKKRRRGPIIIERSLGEEAQ